MNRKTKHKIRMVITLIFVTALIVAVVVIAGIVAKNFYCSHWC